jgi:hypothetical protein
LRTNAHPFSQEFRNMTRIDFSLPVLNSDHLTNPSIPCWQATLMPRGQSVGP